MMLRCIREYFTLLGRNFFVLLADRFSLGMVLFLSPMIALFVILAFWLISNDTHTNDNRIFAAQLFFDTLKLTYREQPYEENEKPPQFFSYPARNAAEAMKGFQEDYTLYNWLFPEVPDRGLQKKGPYDKLAEDIWRDNNGETRFIPEFVLFRYNLPRMLDEDEEKRPYKWPELIEVPKEVKASLNRRAAEAENLKRQINGEESTRSNMTVFFILIAAAIWMGLLPACKEIVAEWDVFLRESRNNISCLAFLLSKFTMLAIITAIQDAILIGIICRYWQDMPIQHCVAFYLILVLTSTCAASIGLLISGVTSTLRQGLMIIPIVMIVQLILGGLLRLPAQTRDNSNLKPIREVASKAMVQYWAFEAVTGIIARLPEAPDTANTAVLLRREVRMVKSPEDQVGSDDDTFDIDYYSETETFRVDDYIFGKCSKVPRYLLKFKELAGKVCEEGDEENFIYHVIRPFSYLLCANAILLLLTCLLIKVKLAINYNGGILAMLFKI